MAKSELLDLIDRYLHGEVSPQEKLKIETWLDVMKTDKSLPQVLTAEEENVLAAKLMSEVDNIEEIKSYRPLGKPPEEVIFQTKRSFFYDRSFRIAASIVILIAVAATLFFFQRSGSASGTLGGGDEKQILADGSIVWLKTGSTLEYQESSDHKFRIASLKGEGLFEVAKDPAKPFKISCGEIQILVTGTSFNLKTTPNGIDLHLFTGHVALSSKSNDKLINVDPKQHVVYKESGEPEISSIPDSEIEALVSTTDYLMVFKDTPLTEIFDKLEKKFDVTIKVEDKQMKKCRIKADFTDTSLEKVFAFLKSQLDLDYAIKGKVVDVSGRGCK